MCVALLVRRRMLVEQGRPDPYGAAVADDEDERDGAKSPVGAGDGGAEAARRVLRRQNEQARRDKSLLRLMHVLSKSASRWPLSLSAPPVKGGALTRR